MFDHVAFGKSIKKLRKAKGFTQKALSIDADIDMSNLSKYELGKEIPPTKVVIKLVNYFGVSVTECTGNRREITKISYLYQIASLLPMLDDKQADFMIKYLKRGWMQHGD